MIQIFITVIIVVFAITLTVIRLVKYLRNPLKECEGCDKHCQICSLEELKKEIDMKKIKNQNSKVKDDG